MPITSGNLRYVLYFVRTKCHQQFKWVLQPRWLNKRNSEGLLPLTNPHNYQNEVMLQKYLCVPWCKLLRNEESYHNLNTFKTLSANMKRRICHIQLSLFLTRCPCSFVIQYWRHRTWSPLLPIMSRYLFGTKPLAEPILTYGQWELWKRTSVNF